LRTERIVPEEVLQQHQIELAQAREQLPEEGYAAIYELNERQIAEAKIRREIILPSCKKSLEEPADSKCFVTA
jgi:hypothetical protein